MFCPGNFFSDSRQIPALTRVSSQISLILITSAFEFHLFEAVNHGFSTMPEKIICSGSNTLLAASFQEAALTDLFASSPRITKLSNAASKTFCTLQARYPPTTHSVRNNISRCLLTRLRTINMQQMIFVKRDNVSFHQVS